MAHGKARRALPPRRVERRRRVWKIAVAGVGAAVLVGGAVATAAYVNLQRNITSIDVASQLGTDRPDPPSAMPSTKQAFEGPLTIAVFGDDTRSGKNGFVGGEKGKGRSDTALVMHLDADRTRATVASIPRDSMVQRPECVDDDGSTIPGGLDMFNAAYTVGGPACSIKTIESLTGVRIDEYVVVDFNGFRKIVDAVGGVEVCVPSAIKDRDSGLDIPAGTTKLDGQQALAFVRNRHGVGDGSDLSRIKSQQLFLSSLAGTVKKMDISDLPKLYAFLNATTSSLTTSPKLGKIANLAELAKATRDLPESEITMLTVPVGEYAPDPNRVQWAPEADKLWKAMREDEPLPKALKPKKSASPKASGSRSASAAPDAKVCG